MVANISKRCISRTNSEIHAKMDTMDVENTFLGTDIIMNKLILNIQIMWWCQHTITA